LRGDIGFEFFLDVAIGAVEAFDTGFNLFDELFDFLLGIGGFLAVLIVARVTRAVVAVAPAAAAAAVFGAPLVIVFV
jgi:hypothetical protein